MATFELADEFIDVEKEDDLTKAVFGCFELLRTETLNAVLEQTGLDIQVESRPEFTFHETVARREPDVILEDGEHLTVLVEAKLDAPTSTNQLSDEYKDLVEGWDSDALRLLLITDDRRCPPGVEERAGVPTERFLWTSWRRVAAALYQVKGGTVDGTDRRVMAMLTQILERKGFAPFDGFTIMKDSQSLTGQLEKAYRVRNQYYTEINSFRKDVESSLTDEVKYWRFFRRGVSGGMGSGQISFPTKGYQRMPKHLWFSYVPQEKKLSRSAQNYLQNYLTLDFNSQTGDVRAGYVVTTAPGKVKNDAFRKILHNRKDAILDMFQEHRLEAYTTSYSLSDTLESTDSIERFLEEIGDPSYDLSEWGKRFMIARTWPAEELPIKDEGDELFEPAEMTKDVASTLNEIHHLTYHEHDSIFYPQVE